MISLYTNLTKEFSSSSTLVVYGDCLVHVSLFNMAVACRHGYVKKERAVASYDALA